MKFDSNRAVIGLHKIFLSLALVMTITIVIYQFPVSIVSGFLGSRTECRVLLHQAIGTIWNGSASLGFSENQLVGDGCRKPTALTERFSWQTQCSLRKMVCRIEIASSALEKPIQITNGFNQTQVSSGQLKVPTSILEAFGNPWKTLRPRGELIAHWDELQKGEINKGNIRIDLRNLSSPISFVKPLGSYEIKVNMTDSGTVFFLATVAGPLLLNGRGSYNEIANDSLNFSGIASSSPESRESLIGLLSILGKKDGDIYRMQY